VNPDFVGKGIYQIGFDYFADKLIAVLLPHHFWLTILN
jgi:hypothetical protein